LANLAEDTIDADGALLTGAKNARQALAAYDAQQQRAGIGGHTAEPWSAEGISGNSPYIAGAPKNPYAPWTAETIADLYFDNDDGTSIVGPILKPYANAAANARRIVACVNACAGIHTELLESLEIGELDAAINDPALEASHPMLGR
jgi:hypothetical protein